MPRDADMTPEAILIGHRRALCHLIRIGVKPCRVIALLSGERRMKERYIDTGRVTTGPHQKVKK